MKMKKYLSVVRRIFSSYISNSDYLNFCCFCNKRYYNRCGNTDLLTLLPTVKYSANPLISLSMKSMQWMWFWLNLVRLTCVTCGSLRSTTEFTDLASAMIASVWLLGGRNGHTALAIIRTQSQKITEYCFLEYMNTSFFSLFSFIFWFCLWVFFFLN